MPRSGGSALIGDRERLRGSLATTRIEERAAAWAFGAAPCLGGLFGKPAHSFLNANTIRNCMAVVGAGTAWMTI